MWKDLLIKIPRHVALWKSHTAELYLSTPNWRFQCWTCWSLFILWNSHLVWKLPWHNQLQHCPWAARGQPCDHCVPLIPALLAACPGNTMYLLCTPLLCTIVIDFFPGLLWALVGINNYTEYTESSSIVPDAGANHSSPGVNPRGPP